MNLYLVLFEIANTQKDQRRIGCHICCVKDTEAAIRVINKLFNCEDWKQASLYELDHNNPVNADNKWIFHVGN